MKITKTKVMAADFDAKSFKDRHKAAQQRRADKQQAKVSKAQAILSDGSLSVDDALEGLFEILVPDAGKADTVAGELVRAMMRILYRDYNDGDVFYEGYGLETCGSSAQYLINTVEDERMYDVLCDCAERGEQDDRYTKSMKKAAEVVLDEIRSNSNLLTDKNTVDSRNVKLDDVEEWVPEYEDQWYLPYNVQWHIEVGHVDERDIQGEISWWDGLSGADVEVNGDTVYISGMDRDTYDLCMESLERWLEDYGNDLDNAYGSEDDYEEEEEYEEDEYDEEDE